MKILQSIQRRYDDSVDTAKIVKSLVDKAIKGRKEDEWFFISRIKKIESFALKLETGRFSSTSINLDLFACTLVVENLDSIARAEDLIRSVFKVSSRAPRSQSSTFNKPANFDFDDIRLICELDELANDKTEEIQRFQFEVQIKTFLQYAWGKATHELTYKSQEISWAKERIAAQVKASLEAAEVAISGAEALSKVPELDKSDHQTSERRELLNFLTKEFQEEDLPADKKRLAENVQKLCYNMNIGIAELSEYLDIETKAGRGTTTRNLSPYYILVRTIYNQNREKFDEYCQNKERKGKFTLVVPPEVEIPRDKSYLQYKITHI